MMRLAIAVLVLCVSVAGCDDSPGSPSALPLVFSSVLSPANEVPPVAGTESAGRGAFQVTFDVTRGAGDAITAATATMYFQLAGFPAGTTIVGAHIHSGPAGVNAPVVINTGLSGANTRTLADGTVELTFSGISVDPALVSAIVANPGGYYFNVHSPVNPGGFARGQLSRVQ